MMTEVASIQIPDKRGKAINIVLINALDVYARSATVAQRTACGRGVGMIGMPPTNKHWPIIKSGKKPIMRANLATDACAQCDVPQILHSDTHELSRCSMAQC